MGHPGYLEIFGPIWTTFGHIGPKIWSPDIDKIESNCNVFHTPGPHKFFSRVPWLLIGYVGPQQTRFSFDRIQYTSINTNISLNAFLHIIIAMLEYEQMKICNNMLTSYIRNMNEILIILLLNIHIIFI